MPRPDEIKHPQAREEDSPNPLPTPGNEEYYHHDSARNQMDGERQNSFRRPQAFVEYVHRKEAYKDCECDAQNSWGPE